MHAAEAISLAETAAVGAASPEITSEVDGDEVVGPVELVGPVVLVEPGVELETSGVAG